jgi:hypothetical protein
MYFSKFNGSADLKVTSTGFKTENLETKIRSQFKGNFFNSTIIKNKLENGHKSQVNSDILLNNKNGIFHEDSFDKDTNILLKFPRRNDFNNDRKTFHPQTPDESDFVTNGKFDAQNNRRQIDLRDFAFDPDRFNRGPADNENPDHGIYDQQIYKPSIPNLIRNVDLDDKELFVSDYVTQENGEYVTFENYDSEDFRYNQDQERRNETRNSRDKLNDNRDHLGDIGDSVSDSSDNIFDDRDDVNSDRTFIKESDDRDRSSGQLLHYNDPIEQNDIEDDNWDGELNQ